MRLYTSYSPKINNNPSPPSNCSQRETICPNHCHSWPDRREEKDSNLIILTGSHQTMKKKMCQMKIERETPTHTLTHTPYTHTNTHIHAHKQTVYISKFDMSVECGNGIIFGCIEFKLVEYIA